MNINGVSVGPLIVGNSAYPIFPWLLKPYQNVGNLDPKKVEQDSSQSGACAWCVEGKVKVFEKRTGNFNRKCARNDSCLL